MAKSPEEKHTCLRTCILVHPRVPVQKKGKHTRGAHRGPAHGVTLAMARHFAESSIPELTDVNTSLERTSFDSP